MYFCLKHNVFRWTEYPSKQIHINILLNFRHIHMIKNIFV